MADDMRTLGYICPKCGAQVMGARSVFALEASDAEIECSCGGSVLRTNYDGQNYHILVPCGVCGQTHEAVCPPERMLHAATALSCPDSKQFCCFIGDEGTVEHHLREASIAISKEKAQENSGEAEAFTDNVIMYEFLSELKDIAARPNGITCGCQPRLQHGNPPGRGGADMPGLRRPPAAQRRHRPGSGRSLLPHEAGHSRREVTVSFYSQKERCKTV